MSRTCHVGQRRWEKEQHDKREEEGVGRRRIRERLWWLLDGEPVPHHRSVTCVIVLNKHVYAVYSLKFAIKSLNVFTFVQHAIELRDLLKFRYPHWRTSTIIIPTNNILLYITWQTNCILLHLTCFSCKLNVM